MGDVYHWTCPYCNRDTTLREGDFRITEINFIIQNPADGHKAVKTYYVVCPNESCRKFTLKVGIHNLILDPNLHKYLIGEQTNSWELIPPSLAKTFPSYIPKPILDDYNEACLIVELSPKASATLSRRCLQGIIRDFFKVQPGRLINEIEQIKDKTDPQTWEAIESVRKIGNIGAHMESDINFIIDVDPKEASTLIELIEMLLKEWYIAREERKKRLERIAKISKTKTDEKKNGKNPE